MCKKNYYYTDARGCSVGLMICEVCHKKITSGEFRYWLSRKGTAYLSEHRDCSQDDPMWKKLDDKCYQKQMEYKELQKACQKFYEDFGLEGINLMFEMFGGE